MLLKNYCVPFVPMQQPLPPYPLCSSSVVGSGVLEALWDVRRGRNKLHLVLFNFPSHPATPHTAQGQWQSLVQPPASATALGDGEGEMASVVFSPAVGCCSGDQCAD